MKHINMQPIVSRLRVLSNNRQKYFLTGLICSPPGHLSFVVSRNLGTLDVSDGASLAPAHSARPGTLASNNLHNSVQLTLKTL